MPKILHMNMDTLLVLVTLQGQRDKLADALRQLLALTGETTSIHFHEAIGRAQSVLKMLDAEDF